MRPAPTLYRSESGRIVRVPVTKLADFDRRYAAAKDVTPATEGAR